MKRFIVQLTEWKEEKGKQVRRNHAYYETATETLKDYYLNHMCKAYTISIYDRLSKKHITMSDLKRLAEYDVKPVTEEVAEEVKEMITVERVTTDDNGNVEDVTVVEWNKNELIRFLIRGNYEQVASNTWKKVAKTGAVRTYTIQEEVTEVETTTEVTEEVTEEVSTPASQELKIYHNFTNKEYTLNEFLASDVFKYNDILMDRYVTATKDDTLVTAYMEDNFEVFAENEGYINYYMDIVTEIKNDIEILGQYTNFEIVENEEVENMEAVSMGKNIEINVKIIDKNKNVMCNENRMITAKEFKKVTEKYSYVLERNEYTYICNGATKIIQPLN